MMIEYRWTFENGIEGWRDNDNNPRAQPTDAANPGAGGAIVVADTPTTVPWFFTPADLSGDQSAIYGGVFSYTFQSQGARSAPLTQTSLFIFGQDGSTIRILNDFPDRTGSTTYTGAFSVNLAVPSTEASYKIDYLSAGGTAYAPATEENFRDVLSQLNYFGIPGDLRNGDEFTRIEDASLIVPCFAGGTMLESDMNPVAVEDLQIGQLVYTRDHGFQPVRWIGSKKLSAIDLNAHPNMRPIRIKAGALGTNIPQADLTVSPQHRVLIRSKIAQRMFGADEVLLAAKALLELDGVEIAEDVAEVEYFHILFDRHEIVISNGTETESLYTGPQALKSLGKAARDEIFALFPKLQDQHTALSARALVPGRLARQAVQRHQKNNQQLVC